MFPQARRNILKLRAERAWHHLPELYVSFVTAEDIMNVLIHLTATVQRMITECYEKKMTRNAPKLFQ
jgi:hypothetical protein